MFSVRPGPSQVLHLFGSLGQRPAPSVPVSRLFLAVARALWLNCSHVSVRWPVDVAGFRGLWGLQNCGGQLGWLGAAEGLHSQELNGWWCLPAGVVLVWGRCLWLF